VCVRVCPDGGIAEATIRVSSHRRAGAVLASSGDKPAPAAAPLEINIPPRPLIEILPRREVDEWLFAVVNSKTVLVVATQREAAARDHSWPRVKRAKQRLGIESEKLARGKGCLEPPLRDQSRTL
jgi:hypothetical protein